MTLVILLGAPGAGKSTVGALLAKELHLPFIDTDKAVEISEGLRVCFLCSQAATHDPTALSLDLRVELHIVDGGPMIVRVVLHLLP